MTSEQIETIADKIVDNILTNSNGQVLDRCSLFDLDGTCNTTVGSEWIRSMVKRVLEKHA